MASHDSLSCPSKLFRSHGHDRLSCPWWAEDAKLFIHMTTCNRKYRNIWQPLMLEHVTEKACNMSCQVKETQPAPWCTRKSGHVDIKVWHFWEPVLCAFQHLLIFAKASGNHVCCQPHMLIQFPVVPLQKLSGIGVFLLIHLSKHDCLINWWLMLEGQNDNIQLD